MVQYEEVFYYQPPTQWVKIPLRCYVCISSNETSSLVYVSAYKKKININKYIEGSRREILEAFWKSPYLYVTCFIDLKIGTWPHHFRKRNIITRAENTILLRSIYFLLLDYLILYKNPSVPDLYAITGTLSI